MELKLNGKVKVIMETQTFDSGFSKREFVVTTQEQYPQDVKLEFVKDKCSLLDSIKVGQDVDVSFNVRGNEYNGRYFVNLNAWKIEAGAENMTVPSNGADTALEPMTEGEDDLPF